MNLTGVAATCGKSMGAAFGGAMEVRIDKHLQNAALLITGEPAMPIELNDAVFVSGDLAEASAVAGAAVGEEIGSAINDKLLGAVDALNLWRKKAFDYATRDRKEYEVFRDRLIKQWEFKMRDKAKEKWDAQEKWRARPQDFRMLAERINDYWREFDRYWRRVR